MKTNDESSDVISGDDISLEDFQKDFYQTETSEPEEQETGEPSDEEEVETDDDLDDPIEELEESDEGEEEEEDTSDSEEPEDKPKPKKDRFQDRINELTAARREAERKAEEDRLAFQKKIDELEAKISPTPSPKAAATDTEVDEGPQPTELNEDGTDKYPLGEYDPKYIRDLTRHTLLAEKNALKAEEEQAKQQQAIQAQRTELETNWQAKLEPAKERYPDFDEKGQNLLSAFEGIDQQYGEYLTSTLMSLDHGPDVLYYLANNPEEAQELVRKGPTGATIALGRLEARFSDDSKPENRPKKSKAPPPPAHRTKGSAQSMPSVSDDTDDLAAFQRKFYKK